MPNLGAEREWVVLLDDDHQPAGSADKAAVHTASTPLHLAFSCHVMNPDGQVLVTRRALTKATWPGVWTNSVCGHPRPGEPVPDAVHRRARFELGLALTGLTPALPDFRYRAVDASGIVENEVCPVYIARATGEPTPRPDEVAEYTWCTPEQLRTAVTVAPWAFSPWLVQHLPRMGSPFGPG